MLLTLSAERMFPQKLIEGRDMSNRLGGSFLDKSPQVSCGGIRIAVGILGLPRTRKSKRNPNGCPLDTTIRCRAVLLLVYGGTYESIRNAR